MSEFIHQQGPAFLAHLLRRLADELVRAGASWYPEVDVTAPPRTTSTLIALDDRGPLGVTEIAALLGQSHPLVIGWIKQLTERGFVDTQSDPQDGRRSIIVLTDEGRAEVGRLREALIIMERASRQLMDEVSPGMFEALWRMDEAVRRKTFIHRLREQARTRSPT